MTPGARCEEFAFSERGPFVIAMLASQQFSRFLWNFYLIKEQFVFLLVIGINTHKSGNILHLYYLKHADDSQKTGKCYHPSKSLTSLMTDLLRLKHDEEETQRKEETRGISETGAERERNEAKVKRAVLNKRKVDLLNKIIFPSMANLTVFLEYLMLSPYLHEIFDKDLQALFFAQSKNPDQKNKEWIFKRFIMASMMQVISIQKAADYGRTYSKNTLLPDYRFIISEIMQIALWEMVMSVGQHKYKSHSEQFLNEMMLQDMGRAASWMKMFAEKARRNSLTFDPVKRPALF